MSRLLLVLLMLGGPMSAWAQVSVPDGIKLYPGNKQVQSSTEADVSYELVLGSLKSVRGRLTPERAERLQGDLYRSTWRLPDGRDPQEVFRFMSEQVETAGWQVLYLCQGRDCGSSNDWANQVFGVAQLYGPDDDQYYLAASKGDGSGQQFAAIYVVRRGNQRLYLHMDVLQASDPAAVALGASQGTLIELLKKHRRLLLSQIRFGEQQTSPELDAEGLQQLALALNRELSLNVAVVSHVASGQGIVRDLELSRSRAREVVDLLVEQGVQRNRLYPFGAGSLVPPLRPSDPRDRVELVIP